ILIRNTYAKGDVKFTDTAIGDNAGGLVGFIEGKALIDGSYHSGGEVRGSMTGTGAGGLIGSGNATDIRNSYNSGNVFGNFVVGGLAGGNGGTILNSYIEGDVTGYNTPTSSKIGGIAGANTGTIANSHALGAVKGQGPNAQTGGL